MLSGYKSGSCLGHEDKFRVGASQKWRCLIWHANVPMVQLLHSSDCGCYLDAHQVT